MARYNGLIIPRSYNDYYRRDDPEAIREIVALAADAELNANSRNPVQNKAVAEVVPNNASTTNLLATHDDVENITKLIPDQVSEENQLADKDFVNSSISSNTAYFRGTYNSVEELEAYAGEKTLNDYAFVIDIDEVSNKSYNRYKYNGTTWEFEYTLNNSSFTAEQWAAIQSGITSELVSLIGQATGSSPIGSIIPYVGENIPAGFLLCDGRELLIEDYDKLYAIIGQLPACQSENEGYFKLPDLRETTIVGAGENTNSNIAEHDVYAIGEFKDDQMQGHEHSEDHKNQNYNGATTNYVNAAPGAGGKTTGIVSDDKNGNPRIGTTTHGKQFGINYIIKATSTNDSVNEIIDDSTKDVGHAWSGEKVAAEIEDAKLEVYSTEETVVGTWIDGKPIYRKVLEFAAVNSVIDISNLNIDTLKSITGFGYNNDSPNDRIDCNFANSEFFFAIFYQSNIKSLRAQASRSIINAKIILEYTKTTD